MEENADVIGMDQGLKDNFVAKLERFFNAFGRLFNAFGPLKCLYAFQGTAKWAQFKMLK